MTTMQLLGLVEADPFGEDLVKVCTVVGVVQDPGEQWPGIKRKFLNRDMLLEATLVAPLFRGLVTGEPVNGLLAPLWILC